MSMRDHSLNTIEKFNKDDIIVPYGIIWRFRRMNEKTLDLLNLCNKCIIKFRGIYAQWSKEHQISYNEMLVLYMLRENGYCSQKEICDNYLLPKQTIHHVINTFKDKGYLIETEDSMPKDKNIF